MRANLQCGMPRILVIKTSSMGDVIHNLPTITDIQRNIPDVTIDWVVEEAFSPIAALHPAVGKIIPVAVRRWRSSFVHAATVKQMRSFRGALRAETYDVVLDTQGLIKSAAIALLAQGERRGYDWASAREPLASWFYHRRYAIDRRLHAVERNRLLTARALGYEIQHGEADYGIAAPAEPLHGLTEKPYAVLLHATSRQDKLWPDGDWIALGKRLREAGIHCLLPWGTTQEKARSERLAQALPGAQVPTALTLGDAACLLAHAAMVVGVDTGLTHLAAALNANVVAIYVATAPELTGLYAGKHAVNLGTAHKPPSVIEVWRAAARLMDTRA
ncbi:MAG: lipopolysaccharide heptosyltransferase I [Burkholderiales bacterium]|nr:lipopolysaccharide heptosyltransferase I [Burkholderiales bacterium]